VHDERKSVSMHVAFLAAALLVLESGAPSEPRSLLPPVRFHKILEAQVRVSVPVDTSSGECCETGPPCALIFVGPDDRIYLHDLSRLTVFESGGNRLIASRSVPGPNVDVPPRDGLALDDGTLVLLFDHGTKVPSMSAMTAARYRIAVLGPRDVQWRISDYFDDPEIGWALVQGQRVPGRWNLYLVMEGDEVLLSNGERAIGAAVVLNTDSTGLAHPVGKRLPPGLRTRVGVLSRDGSTVRFPSGHNGSPNGEFIGIDRDENPYYIGGPMPPFYIERYSLDGGITARSTIPIGDHPSSCFLLGKGFLQVSRAGTVFKFAVVDSTLFASAWKAK
jgi:hypothetical protein